jgi:hypothetical protein
VKAGLSRTGWLHPAPKPNRVGLLVPDNEDLAAVRLSLERELGETVSRRLAAKLLGVSHTALDRWVEPGDARQVLYRWSETERIDPLYARRRRVLLGRTDDLPTSSQERKHLETMLRAIATRAN